MRTPLTSCMATVAVGLLALGHTPLEAAGSGGGKSHAGSSVPHAASHSPSRAQNPPTNGQNSPAVVHLPQRTPASSQAGSGGSAGPRPYAKTGNSQGPASGQVPAGPNNQAAQQAHQKVIQQSPQGSALKPAQIVHTPEQQLAISNAKNQAAHFKALRPTAGNGKPSGATLTAQDVGLRPATPATTATSGTKVAAQRVLRPATSTTSASRATTPAVQQAWRQAILAKAGLGNLNNATVVAATGQGSGGSPSNVATVNPIANGNGAAAHSFVHAPVRSTLSQVTGSGSGNGNVITNTANTLGNYATTAYNGAASTVNKIGASVQMPGGGSNTAFGGASGISAGNVGKGIGSLGNSVQQLGTSAPATTVSNAVSGLNPTRGGFSTSNVPTPTLPTFKPSSITGLGQSGLPSLPTPNGSTIRGLGQAGQPIVDGTWRPTTTIPTPQGPNIYDDWFKNWGNGGGSTTPGTTFQAGGQEYVVGNNGQAYPVVGSGGQDQAPNTPASQQPGSTSPGLPGPSDGNGNPNPSLPYDPNFVGPQPDPGPDEKVAPPDTVEGGYLTDQRRSTPGQPSTAPPAKLLPPGNGTAMSSAHARSSFGGYLGQQYSSASSGVSAFTAPVANAATTAYNGAASTVNKIGASVQMPGGGSNTAFGGASGISAGNVGKGIGSLGNSVQQLGTSAPATTVSNAVSGLNPTRGGFSTSNVPTPTLPTFKPSSITGLGQSGLSTLPTFNGSTNSGWGQAGQPINAAAIFQWAANTKPFPHATLPADIPIYDPDTATPIATIHTRGTIDGHYYEIGVRNQSVADFVVDAAFIAAGPSNAALQYLSNSADVTAEEAANWAESKAANGGVNYIIDGKGNTAVNKIDSAAQKLPKLIP